jgi:hypothetical protein
MGLFQARLARESKLERMVNPLMHWWPLYSTLLASRIGRVQKWSPRPASDRPARHELPQPAGTLGGSRQQADDVRHAVAQKMLATKRADTNSRNNPKAISSFRFDSRCASTAP